jgi:hypothetical protein
MTLIEFMRGEGALYTDDARHRLDRAMSSAIRSEQYFPEITRRYLSAAATLSRTAQHTVQLLIDRCVSRRQHPSITC